MFVVVLLCGLPSCRQVVLKTGTSNLGFTVHSSTDFYDCMRTPHSACYFILCAVMWMCYFNVTSWNANCKVPVVDAAQSLTKESTDVQTHSSTTPSRNRLKTIPSPTPKTFRCALRAVRLIERHFSKSCSRKFSLNSLAEAQSAGLRSS